MGIIEVCLCRGAVAVKIPAKVRPISDCAPLYLVDDRIPGTATMGDGEIMKVVLVRESGHVHWETPEGRPLERIVQFFDYDPPS